MLAEFEVTVLQSSDRKEVPVRPDEWAVLTDFSTGLPERKP